MNIAIKEWNGKLCCWDDVPEPTEEQREKLAMIMAADNYLPGVGYGRPDMGIYYLDAFAYDGGSTNG